MKKKLDGYSDYDIYDDGRVYSHKVNRGRIVGWMKPSNSSTNPDKNYLVQRIISDEGKRKSFKIASFSCTYFYTKSI